MLINISWIKYFLPACGVLMILGGLNDGLSKGNWSMLQDGIFFTAVFTAVSFGIAWLPRRGSRFRMQAR